MSYAGLADIYAGALLNGVKHGQGILVSRDGSYYEGGWTNGTEQGQGGIKSWPIREKERLEPRLAEVAGGKYTGEFFRGNAQGKGVRSWTEGPLAQCKYDGDFWEGVRHGPGNMTCRRGGNYYGQYSCGLKQGMGQMIFENGEE